MGLFSRMEVFLPPAGIREYKPPFDERRDDNPGCDGSRGGDNMSIAAEDYSAVTFCRDVTSRMLEIESGSTASGMVCLLDRLLLRILPSADANPGCGSEPESATSPGPEVTGCL